MQFLINGNFFPNMGIWEIKYPYFVLYKKFSNVAFPKCQYKMKFCFIWEIKVPKIKELITQIDELQL